MVFEDNILLLLQMADSSFPVGGFAYSYGLESAVKQGFFNNQEALRSYLITYSEQLISFDFAFVSSAYHLDPAENQSSPLRELIQGYESMLMNPPIQRANEVMGRNWIKICRQISDTYELEELEVKFSKGKVAFEFPVVFGCCLRLLNLDLKKVLNLYFYMALRDQVSAMIRLGVAGPTRAHIELRYLMEHFRKKVNDYAPLPYQQAYKTAYLLEIAQLKHEKVYSKLFQN